MAGELLDHSLLLAMDIIVNGEAHAVPEACTLSGLIESLGLDGSRLAVELDGIIVRRPQWAATTLRAAANVEIVHFVGGG